MSNLKGAPDFSRHLSTLSKSRHASPLKDIIKYMSEPGMTSLAGGLPHPSLFPFKSADLEVFVATADLSPDQRNAADFTQTTKIHLSRDGSPADNTLSKAMQYTGGAGDPQLTQLCRDFVKNVYKPARDDFQILLSSGSTDAWAKVVQLLCEPGDYILVEQFVYPSAQHVYIPMGCKGVPVSMDGDGLIPEALEETLEAWESTHPGVKRPHVLYLVPTGQNPTGATLTWERKQRIYDLAVKYDLIIVEDEPYYWLQLPPYHSPEDRLQLNGSATPAELVPPFLACDTEGRVIRLETFSKTIAPGLRLGYFVANPVFIERLIRATEVQTQAPSGWSQAIVLELLKSWGESGYLTWLSNLKDAYRCRRDWMCDAMAEHFSLRPAKQAGHGVSAYLTNSSGEETKIMNFVPPKAGMFVWVEFDLTSNPQYKALRQSKDRPEAIAEWSHSFWLQLIEQKVLLTPGSYYQPWQGPGVESKVVGDLTYFRLAYSFEAQEDIAAGIEKLAKAIQGSWSD